MKLHVQKLFISMALSAEVSLEGWLIHLMNFYLEQN